MADKDNDRGDTWDPPTLEFLGDLQTLTASGAFSGDDAPSNSRPMS
jgi:hypothetical protein